MMSAPLFVYLMVGVLASVFALIRSCTVNADLRSDLRWSHVLTMLVGLIATWPFVLVDETLAWWRER